MEMIPVVREMTRRGLRVDEGLRRDRIKALEAEVGRLVDEAEPIVAPWLEKAKNPHLFWSTKACQCCGRRNRENCWVCAGYIKRPSKKAEKAQYLASPVPCRVCNGSGDSREYKGFNPGSTQQVIDILHNCMKLPARHQDSKVTVDEEALQSLMALDKSGLVKILLHYGKLDTSRSIYERIEPASDGRVRTVYNPAGAYTGRFNSASAFYIPYSTNLQNLPNEMEGLRNPLFAVRDCIVPDEDEVLMYADLSQSEARIVACLSDERYLIDLFASGRDVHRWTAGQIYKVDEGAISKEDPRRYVGKRARHSLNYGLGPKKFWRQVNSDADVTGIAITLGDAKRIYAAYHALHPSLDQFWWNRVEKRIQELATMETTFGRGCTFYPRYDPDTGRIDAETLRAAIAYEPQSTSVDCLNGFPQQGEKRQYGLLGLYKAEKGYRVLHQGHDSVMLGVQKAAVKEMAEIAKQSLEREMKINGHTLVIPAEVFVCPVSWGKMERVL